MNEPLPPNTGFRTTGRSRLGEPWVWLTAAGLSIGVMMALGLFLLILIKGAASFWPRPIEVMEVRNAEGATEKIAGFVTQESTRREPDGTEHREIQVFRGNKDIRPEAFVFIDEANIVSRSRPEGLMWVERMEYGPGIIEPVAIETPDGRIEASDPSFHDKLEAVIERSEEARDEILDIERKQIGRISRELEKLDRAERGGAEESAERRAELQASFEKLQAESGVIHNKLKETKLVGRTVDGADVSYTSDVLVRTFMPNAAGFFDRLGEALSRVGAFLSEDPREANTEGGVFPAIFGTVVMTLAMSFFVTPFGVIAAIYLREYASQGLMVQFVRISVNNLAGVPSIVFGVFGLAFFVYTVGGTVDQWFFSDKLPTPTYGTPGILWASLTLALLTLPVVIVATEEALAAVPRGVREAALACGASKWQTIQRVVLPASLPGILTGVILAMARGAGEVAPLMLVGVVKLAPSLPIDSIAPFVHPERKFMHLGFHIYDLGFQSPDAEAAKPIVYATALLLIVVVVTLNLTAILIRNRLKKKFAVSSF